jgi:hypothetical protein
MKTRPLSRLSGSRICQLQHKQKAPAKPVLKAKHYWTGAVWPDMGDQLKD